MPWSSIWNSWRLGKWQICVSKKLMDFCGYIKSIVASSCLTLLLPFLFLQSLCGLTQTKSLEPSQPKLVSWSRWLLCPWPILPWPEPFLPKWETSPPSEDCGCSTMNSREIFLLNSRSWVIWKSSKSTTTSSREKCPMESVRIFTTLDLRISPWRVIVEPTRFPAATNAVLDVSKRRQQISRNFFHSLRFFTWRSTKKKHTHSHTHTPGLNNIKEVAQLIGTSTVTTTW